GVPARAWRSTAEAMRGKSAPRTATPHPTPTVASRTSAAIPKPAATAAPGCADQSGPGLLATASLEAGASAAKAADAKRRSATVTRTPRHAAPREREGERDVVEPTAVISNLPLLSSSCASLDATRCPLPARARPLRREGA